MENEKNKIKIQAYKSIQDYNENVWKSFSPIGYVDCKIITFEV